MFDRHLVRHCGRRHAPGTDRGLPPARPHRIALQFNRIPNSESTAPLSALRRRETANSTQTRRPASCSLTHTRPFRSQPSQELRRSGWTTVLNLGLAIPVATVNLPQRVYPYREQHGCDDCPGQDEAAG